MIRWHEDPPIPAVTMPGGDNAVLNGIIDDDLVFTDNISKAVVQVHVDSAHQQCHAQWAIRRSTRCKLSLDMKDVKNILPKWIRQDQGTLWPKQTLVRA